VCEYRGVTHPPALTSPAHEIHILCKCSSHIGRKRLFIDNSRTQKISCYAPIMTKLKNNKIQHLLLLLTEIILKKLKGSLLTGVGGGGCPRWGIRIIATLTEELVAVGLAI
jgi:hypothetical protein